MAHITEFSIKGLVGRKEPYAKKLNRDVNVFFGINGSGKTTLLKILHSAMRGDTSILKDAYFQSAEVTIYSKDYDKEFIYSIKKPKRSNEIELEEMDFQNLDPDDMVLFSDEAAFEWKSTPRLPDKAISKWRHAYLPTTRLFVGFKVPQAQRQGRVVSETELESQFASSLQTIWSTYFTRVLSAVREVQQSGLQSILREVIAPKKRGRKTTQVDIDAAYDRVESFLVRQGPSGKPLIARETFQNRYKADALLRHVVDDIERVEESIDKAMLPKNKLQIILSEMFSNKKVSFDNPRLTISNPDGTDLNLSSLSAGEKHLLWIMVEVLRVQESTVLIDEPELSMHIDWQKTLISSMRQVNPDAQLILATHSPEIMSEIDDNRIFRV